MRKVLAFDIGTSSIKASLWDEKAICIGEAVVDYPTFSSPDGIFREQSPIDWWESINAAAHLLLDARDDRADIVGIGISGHSLGVVPMDENGDLLCDCTPLWSDARAKAQADRFFEKTDYSAWYQDTGCGFPAELYGMFKIMWYKDNMPDVYRNAVSFLGTKDYINFRMTGKYATDHCYAAGSGAYSLSRRAYSDEYIRLAGLDADKFPHLYEPHDILGTLDGKIAADWGLSEDVKIACGSVDNSCMCLGTGCIHEGDSYISLGSSAWVAACTGGHPKEAKGGIYTFPHPVEGIYIPAAAVFSAGTSLEWYMKTMWKTENDRDYASFDRLAASAPAGSNGVIFCPTLTGGTEQGASNMKGGFCGISTGTSDADMARSVLEGIAMGMRCAMKVMSSELKPSNTIAAVGGGAGSPVWMDIYSDVFGKNVVCPKVSRSAASLGAAAIAFRAVGAWEDYEIIAMTEDSEAAAIYAPDNKEAYQKIYARFEKYYDAMMKLD